MVLKIRAKPLFQIAERYGVSHLQADAMLQQQIRAPI